MSARTETADEAQCRLIAAYLVWYHAERRVSEQRARWQRDSAAYRERRKNQPPLSGQWNAGSKAAAALRRKSA